MLSSPTSWVTSVIVAVFSLSGSVNAQNVEGRQDAPSSPPEDPYSGARERMVQRHLVERGITDARVLDAFRKVPRHQFVPEEYVHLAYEDSSIPIGEAQTITNPFDVAFMTQALDPKPTDKVFEVGTGSGFQAAILGQLVAEVYSVEIHEPLGTRAAKVLADLGYDNIHTRVGDGYAGWPEAAPFDAVIVTCAPEKIPVPLVEQLKEGGRMVIPLGSRYLQKLYILDKKDGKMVGRAEGGTLFVPMTGRARVEGGDEPVPEPAPPGAPDQP